MPDLADLEALIAQMAKDETLFAARRGSDTPGGGESRPRGARLEHCSILDEVDAGAPRFAAADAWTTASKTGRRLVRAHRGEERGNGPDGHQEQLLATPSTRVPLAVLTDGLNWWLYLPVIYGGPLGAAPVLEHRLPQQESAAAGRSLLRRFLGRAAKRQRSARYEEARGEFEQPLSVSARSRALPEAWEKVLSDPDGLHRSAPRGPMV